MFLKTGSEDESNWVINESKKIENSAYENGFELFTLLNASSPNPAIRVWLGELLKTWVITLETSSFVTLALLSSSRILKASFLISGFLEISYKIEESIARTWPFNWSWVEMLFERLCWDCFYEYAWKISISVSYWRLSTIESRGYFPSWE